MPQICIVPRVDGIGGVASFRLKMEAGLATRGIRVVNDANDPQNDAVLVVAGTRRVDSLLRAKRRGIPIVQRLDGLNWIHRLRFVSLKHTFRSITGNALLTFTRRFMADKVIYQSQFVQRWWDDWYGGVKKPAYVIYNGVDLNMYTPFGKNCIQPSSHYRLLLVEGNLGNGYEIGLENALRLAEIIQTQHGLSIELMVVGKIAETHQQWVSANSRVKIQWMGRVSRDRIPEINRSAHLFFSADLNAACPNAVIEALACGSPVVAFDTGALKELVTPEAGIIVPYGADPWQVEPPNVAALAEKIPALLSDLPRYQTGARRRAEEAFSLDTMVDQYLNVLLG